MKLADVKQNIDEYFEQTEPYLICERLGYKLTNEMVNLLAIGGHISSGKDTVAKIIQYLVAESKKENLSFTLESYLDNKYFIAHEYFEENSSWQIKKFADKTTQSFETITGINYHKLDRKEKEKIRPLYIDFAETNKKVFGDDVWVNSLFSEYKPELKPSIQNEVWSTSDIKKVYPNWIITDMRFPNEFKAVKDRGGITIRVNRTYENPCKNIPLHEHPSETALDNEIFDYHIDNDGTMEELIEKVRVILIELKLI